MTLNRIFLGDPEAYTDRKLKLTNSRDADVDTLQVVLEWLDENGLCFMVLDNADDRELFFGEASTQVRKKCDAQPVEKARMLPLTKYIPRSRSGLILMTARDRMIGESWVIGGAKLVINVFPFNAKDAKQLLCTRISENQTRKDAEIAELLEAVDYLPLAISQAATYISEQDISITRH